MIRVTVLVVGPAGVEYRSHADGSRATTDQLQVLGDPVEFSLGWIGGDGILVVDEERKAVRCRVVAIGNEANPMVRLRGALPGGSIDLPLARLGLADRRESQQAQGVSYLVIDLGATPPDHWDHDGGLDGWRAARAADTPRPPPPGVIHRKPAAKLHEGAAVVRRYGLDWWDRRFVNPYTFVPFPPGAQGSATGPPAGHDRLVPGLLAGAITVRWRTESPLLVRASTADKARWRFPTRPAAGGGVDLIVPGSSVKGAVRSLHETLAGGCLRVVDEEFVPAYRDVPSPPQPGWTLARVDRVDADGRPEQVTICDHVVWVPVEHLHPAVGGAAGLRTGAAVGIDESFVTNDRFRQRDEIPDPRGVTAGDGWVVLVADDRTRRNANAYYCAVGRLSALTAEVPQPAWALYRQAVEGADDIRRARKERLSGNDSVFAAVKFANAIVSYRRTAALHLGAGDVIWVHRPDGAQIEKIALSVVWRRPGRGALGDRVPPGLTPARRRRRCAYRAGCSGRPTPRGGGGPAHRGSRATEAAAAPSAAASRHR